MSVEAMAWALGVPVGGNAKVVLLGLANHAHADGTNAYPSLDRLATYAHCDRSTARRNVRRLEQDGWIRREGLGPQGQTRYALAMGDPFVGGSNSPPVAECNGGTGASGGVAPAPPEPSKEPSESSSAADAGVEIPRSMLVDAEELLRRKVKVGTQRVQPEEMTKAAAALAAFNVEARADYGLGANLTGIVGRIRERPSYDAAMLVRLVRSAWRIRWWERSPSRRRRPTPAVIFGNANVFEAVVQDAIDEKAGRRVEPESRSGRYMRED